MRRALISLSYKIRTFHRLVPISCNWCVLQQSAVVQRAPLESSGAQDTHPTRILCSIPLSAWFLPTPNTQVVFPGHWACTVPIKWLGRRLFAPLDIFSTLLLLYFCKSWSCPKPAATHPSPMHGWGENFAMQQPIFKERDHY